MKKTVEVWKEYRKFHGQKAIDQFFKAYPELGYWKETFEWMLETGTDFFCDNTLADGTRNKNWCYALHFDETSEHVTYICIIERAAA